MAVARLKQTSKLMKEAVLKLDEASKINLLTLVD